MAALTIMSLTTWLQNITLETSRHTIKTTHPKLRRTSQFHVNFYVTLKKEISVLNLPNTYNDRLKSNNARFFSSRPTSRRPEARFTGRSRPGRGSGNLVRRRRWGLVLSGASCLLPWRRDWCLFCRQSRPSPRRSCLGHPFVRWKPCLSSLFCCH